MPLPEDPMVLRTNKIIPLLYIQPPSWNKDILRPKPNPRVPHLTRKPRALPNQSTTKAKTPCARLNKKETQLACVGGISVSNKNYAAQELVVALGDPAPICGCVVVVEKFCTHFAY
ncbi:hypothetical protein PENFLA_c035G10647 [Penicillium flavigenum]|uniref:Uncharacterized protein n=1 Tax=Penicillium flavigenum TaxID=254877 RepID=A0A1V6SMG3_9EURO|nr:hypothetical protein PENFLA_c035G10647 [Penicillium flavigenum]